MAVESAPRDKKAFYSSGVQVGYGIGLVLATGFVSLLSHGLGDAAFRSWGWRRLFVFSIVLVGYRPVGARKHGRIERNSSKRSSISIARSSCP